MSFESFPNQEVVSKSESEKSRKVKRMLEAAMLGAALATGGQALAQKEAEPSQLQKVEKQAEDRITLIQAWKASDPKHGTFLIGLFEAEKEDKAAKAEAQKQGKYYSPQVIREVFINKEQKKVIDYFGMRDGTINIKIEGKLPGSVEVIYSPAQTTTYIIQKYRENKQQGIAMSPAEEAKFSEMERNYQPPSYTMIDEKTGEKVVIPMEVFRRSRN